MNAEKVLQHNKKVHFCLVEHKMWGGVELRLKIFGSEKKIFFLFFFFLCGLQEVVGGLAISVGGIHSSC